jgi:putative oxygen-independent coproporphyrinogen III oxidase
VGSRPPEGKPPPPDGSLPPPAVAAVGSRPFGVYVHVPYCAARCGYCDFNTYTAAELGGGASQATYAATAIGEVRLARRVLGEAHLPVSTVFFGGGTPTLLPAEDLGAILAGLAGEFALTPGAEVTSEANPESVDPASLERLREQGVNRLSLGMQSGREHVLATLDRRHRPGRPEACVRWAREAGFERVSLDLIYGTPGETLADWRASLDAALGAGADHVSAYALVVEPGTALARRVARGELPAPDEDDLADKYLLADEVLQAAGMPAYELSNWARAGHECRHNLGYWRNDDWWGIGPGAHSHVQGVRWWNVRHPAAYADRLAAGHSPAQAREVLDRSTRRTEDVLLRLRLAEGLPVDRLSRFGRVAAARALADGLLEPEPYPLGRLVLTLRGRLLADAVVRELVD